MASLDPIDGRSEADAALVALLRSADRVLIGLKDFETAVLQLGHVADERYAVLHARVQRLPGATIASERPLAIADARHDAYWSAAVDALRPGCRITVVWSLGWGGVGLEFDRPSDSSLVWAGRHAEYSLGRTNVRRRPRTGETYVVRSRH